MPNVSKGRRRSSHALGNNRRHGASNTASSETCLSQREIERVAQCMLDLKRKRDSKPENAFNLLYALISRPELMELTARWLDPDSLCALYTASRRFHHLMNTRYHYYIKGCASIWSPFGKKCFPSQAFRKLCIEDPGARPIPYAKALVRHIPGIRWLKMVASRQKVVDEILGVLDRAGHRLPRDIHITLQKMWFTMSIAGNGARIGLFHNRDYWTDQDLYLAKHFCIKFDMFCTDPINGTGKHVLRDIFLSKRSLVPMHTLLHGGYNSLAIMQHHVSFNYRLPASQQHLSVLGIPADLVGQGCMEAWGAGSERALGVAEGVILESLHRNIQMNQHFLDMMLYGGSDITDNVAYHLDCKKPREFNVNVQNVDWRIATYGIEEV